MKYKASGKRFFSPARRKLSSSTEQRLDDLNFIKAEQQNAEQRVQSCCLAFAAQMRKPPLSR